MKRVKILTFRHCQTEEQINKKIQEVVEEYGKKEYDLDSCKTCCSIGYYTMIIVTLIFKLDISESY